jgi:hypothetical protein
MTSRRRKDAGEKNCSQISWRPSGWRWHQEKARCAEYGRTKDGNASQCARSEENRKKEEGGEKGAEEGGQETTLNCPRPPFASTERGTQGVVSVCSDDELRKTHAAWV